MDNQGNNAAGNGGAGSESGQPAPRPSPRITHHEIKAMKAVTTKAPPAHLSAMNKVKNTLTDMVSSFIIPFAGKKGSQCELNGHVFPKGQWEGDYPRCAHCGKEIKSDEEVGTQ